MEIDVIQEAFLGEEKVCENIKRYQIPAAEREPVNSKLAYATSKTVDFAKEALLEAHVLLSATKDLTKEGISLLAQKTK